ncbi:unnamed protein product [Menidia menidia]|uniref:(Atlantic silverside) hypothetical protein n=1 Tax=Menidia menidia TaxID=238744 RepID=A0A8S4BRA0_9TELE|nr:unnamed protein product [Menidia menidia]
MRRSSSFVLRRVVCDGRQKPNELTAVVRVHVRVHVHIRALVSGWRHQETGELAARELLPRPEPKSPILIHQTKTESSNIKGRNAEAGGAAGPGRTRSITVPIAGAAIRDLKTSLNPPGRAAGRAPPPHPPPTPHCLPSLCFIQPVGSELNEGSELFCFVSVGGNKLSVLSSVFLMGTGFFFCGSGEPVGSLVSRLTSEAFL